MMDLLEKDVKGLFFRYFIAAFGGSMIAAVYTLVDSAMIGHYEGAIGIAALATVSPLWSVIFSLGLLCGIGGAVLMAEAKGGGHDKRGNEYFTAALFGTFVITILVWAGIIFFDDQILRFCGADDEIVLLAKEYLYPVKFAVPCFIFGQCLCAFLRNDNAPNKAMAAVLLGGVINVVGDYYCIYILDMGIFGAGLATALGQGASLLLVLSHFVSKKCTLKITKPQFMFEDIGMVVKIGFAAFFVDIAMGIVTVLFNRQIMYYSDATALAVYGVIVDVVIFAQCSAYGIGQAAQPIISANFGAKNWRRVQETQKWALRTVIAVTMMCVILTCGFPLFFIYLFMNPNDQVLAIAPFIMRAYCCSFILLPFNIYCTYYFQAIMEAKKAFVIAILRGLVLSGILAYVMPYIFGINGLWFVMLISEFVTAIVAIMFIKRRRFKV